MHYYVDGYNLLFRSSYPEGELQVVRDRLIRGMRERCELLKVAVTLVFDSMHQPGEATRAHLPYLTVVYTNAGETADEYILEALRAVEQPRQQVVVTSDRQLAHHARRLGAKTEPINSFLTWLAHRYKKQLRQQATKRKQQLPALPSPPPLAKPPKKEEAPTSEAAAEACFDYYLKVFESRAEKAEPVKPARPVKRTPRSKKPPQAPKEFGKSDYLRWLKAFEEPESS